MKLLLTILLFLSLTAHTQRVFQSGTLYSKGDTVTSNTISYVALRTFTAKALPVNNTYWKQVIIQAARPPYDVYKKINELSLQLDKVERLGLAMTVKAIADSVKISAFLKKIEAIEATQKKRETLNYTVDTVRIFGSKIIKQ